MKHVTFLQDSWKEVKPAVSFPRSMPSWEKRLRKPETLLSDEKEKIVNLTEDGVKKVEKFFHIENLADPENLEIQHNIILALRAHNLMFRDQDYVV